MNKEKTKKCPFCAEEINSEAIVCKHCHKELDKNKVKKAQYKWGSGQIGCAIIFIVLIIIMFASYSSTDTSSNNVNVPKIATESQAELISQSFIKPLLKSPSSADFPLFDYNSYNLKNGKWKIVSYVDSENSFGAQIRTHYSAILTHNSGDWSLASNWTLNELVIDGEIIYSEDEL